MTVTRFLGLNPIPEAVKQLPFPYSDGDWQDRRCFVVGGGSSLKDFDWDLLRGENWIGTNRAWVHNPTIHFVLDLRYQRELVKDPAWLSWSGCKVWQRTRLTQPNQPNVPVAPSDVHLVGSPGKVWSRSLSQGIVHGSNIGTCAINFADILAGPHGLVYLLGFDLYGEGGQVANWHNDYPPHWKSSERAYERFKKNIELYAPQVKARVVNISFNGKTALRCWPIENQFPSRKSA